MENGMQRNVDFVIPKSKLNWKKELLKLLAVGLTALGGLSLLMYVRTNIFSILAVVVAIAVVAWLTEQDTRGPSRIPISGKTVMVVGCETGPGQMLVKHLDSLGVNVFACIPDVNQRIAGCLRAQCSERMRLIPLDVRSQKDITRCAIDIKATLQNFTKKSLWGLTIFTGSISAEGGNSDPLEEFRVNTHINQLGTIGVLHTFSSVMRPLGGRVVHVDLDADTHRRGNKPAYKMVMSAINTFLTTLKHELSDLKIHVISVLYFGDRLVGTPPTEQIEEDSHKDDNSSSMDSLPEVGQLVYEDLVHKIANALFDLKPSSKYTAGQKSVFTRLRSMWT